MKQLDVSQHKTQTATVEPLKVKKLSFTSRQRVIRAINHLPVDRIPFDIGGTYVTGINVSVVAKLREALGLDKPGTPVKVIETYQMLGEIAPDLRAEINVDVVYLGGPRNFFGFENTDWKPWTLSDGTAVLVPGKFNTKPEPNGDILMYPQGDRSVPASGRMPKGGFYFDAIIRQMPINELTLVPEDNLEEFTLLTDEDLRYYTREADSLYRHTDMAIVMGAPGTAFGDVANIPGVWMKYPKGIRDIEEWYMSIVSRQSYIFEIFSRQLEIAVENLKLLYQALGDKIQVVFTDGTDFAAQNSLFIGIHTYREMYKPFHKKLNDWIHVNTPWKVMKHCCGACEPLIDDFVDAGFDILNPVQCSAKGMEPEHLASKYADKIVFWGGGVDTQDTLPLGTPREVERQVTQRMRIFGKNRGFIMAGVHNIQYDTPIENLIAMIDAVRNARTI